MSRYTVRFHSGLSYLPNFEVEGVKAKSGRAAIAKARETLGEVKMVQQNRLYGRGACWSAEAEKGRSR